MRKINYSIIIPNKNLVRELERCLNSIPHRDDIEIIVVDDNSSSEIVDFKNYPGSNLDNIKIIFSKTGRGAGAARNEGLKEASGKWIIFIDSDDYLLPCANDLMDKYMDSEYDLIFFLPDSAYNETLLPANRHLQKVQETNKLANNQEALIDYLRYEYTEPWGKFVKKELINNNDIHFQESKVANDYLFSVKTGYFAQNIHFDKSQIYCVTVREGSLCYSNFDDPQKVESRLEVYYSVQNFYMEHSINKNPFDLLFIYIFRKKPLLRFVLKNFCLNRGLPYHRQLISSCLSTFKEKIFSKR